MIHSPPIVYSFSITAFRDAGGSPSRPLHGRSSAPRRGDGRIRVLRRGDGGRLMVLRPLTGG